MSVEQLDDRAAVLKVLWNKVLEGPFDQETWNATLEEAEVKARIDGPFSWDDLEAKFRWQLDSCEEVWHKRKVASLGS